MNKLLVFCSLFLSIRFIHAANVDEVAGIVQKLAGSADIIRNTKTKSYSCKSMVYKYGLKDDKLVPLCSRGLAYLDVCLSAAYNHGLRDDALVKACSKSNEHSAVCFLNGYNYGLRLGQLTTLCEMAHANITGCLSNSFNMGLRDDKLVESCK